MNELKLQAIYTIPQLIAASASPLSHNTMKAWLRRSGVEFIRNGRRLYIPLSEIEDKMPVFYECLLRVNQRTDSH